MTYAEHLELVDVEQYRCRVSALYGNVILTRSPLSTGCPSALPRALILKTTVGQADHFAANMKSAAGQVDTPQ